MDVLIPASSLLRFARRSCVPVLLLLMLAAPAGATNVTVGCSGASGTFDFASIQAALDSLDKIGPHTITVSGTCTEGVDIEDYQSVKIQGSPTATVIAPIGFDTFSLGNSRGIALRSLVIQGADPSQAGGIVAAFSQFSVTNSTIEQTVDGIFLVQQCTLSMSNVTVRNNQSGIFADENSFVGVGGVSLIQNNLDVALFLNRASIGNIGGNTIIENHTANGVQLFNGSMLRIGGPGVQIRNNGCTTDPTCGGIYATRNSVVRVNTIQITGNSGSGIFLDELTSGFFNAMVMSGNSGDAVTARHISVADFSFGGNSISAGGGTTVSCDGTSLMVDDPVSIATKSCKLVDKSKTSRNEKIKNSLKALQ